MLSENREVMDHLAEFLIKEETITGKEFMEIFHKYRLEQMELPGWYGRIRQHKRIKNKTY